MGTDVLEFTYLVCFFLGLGFAVLSGILGGVFSGGAEAHVDVGGVHVPGGSGVEGPVHFPLLSPVTLAMFVSTFGGVGYLLKHLTAWPAVVQVPVAGVSGVLVGGGVSWLFFRIMRSVESSSQPLAEEGVGAEAEVILAIPAEGLGEIAFVLRGSRTTSPARSDDGQAYPQGASVRIVKSVGGTYLVRKLIRNT
jgi:membrane protein implicated in regulation of membrane protease activity